MANPQDNRKRAKTALDLILEKLGVKPSATPEPPAPSYFDKPEPDREEERKGAARVNQAAAAQKSVDEAKDKNRQAKAFASASLSDEIKLDQRIAAIADETQRQTANEARKDAKSLLEINKAKIQKVLDKDREFWKPYDLSRPAPQDTARQQNQDRNEAIANLYREQIANQDKMERVIAAAEAKSWRITPQITNEQLLITHQPVEEPTFLSGWLTETFGAAAPQPPAPPSPDVDISR